MHVTRGIEKIVPYKPGKPIDEVERELGVTNLIKMASNENTFGPSPKALEALRLALPKAQIYPDGDCYFLKKKLSEKLGFSRDEIMVGNGSNEVINVLIRTFMTGADRGLVGQNAFPMFKLHVMAIDADVVEVPQKNDRFDLRAMLDRLDDKVKLVYIPNPNNPTGTYVTEEELDSFLAATRKRELLVILDEAYFEFVSKPDYPNGLELYKKYPHLVVTRTFSKVHGLSGLRVGYCVARPEIVANLNKVREPFNVNAIAQAAATAALDDVQHVETSVKKTAEGVAWLTNELKALDFKVLPSVANFVLVRTTQNAGEIFQKLLYEGIVVRHTAAFGYPDHLRVTVGNMDDNRRFLSAFKKITGIC